MTHSKLHKKYGWKPSLPDHRDFLMAVDPDLHPLVSGNLFNQKRHMPPVYDQLQIGSCVDNALAFVTQYNLMNGFKADKPVGSYPTWMPSRLFLYWFARKLEGTTNSDSGSTVRDGLKALARWGICQEALWNYDESILYTPPSAAAMKEALKFLGLVYYSIPDSNRLAGISQAIGLGNPVVFGFTVYESFESETTAQTGIVTMPKSTEQLLGGHCVAAVGINVTDRYVLCRNSWGVNWGVNGYFKMPFEYITSANLADDFWVLTQTK